MQRRATFTTRTESLADKRQVRAVISTETLGADGLVVRTAGINLDRFRANSIVLWSHDPETPIARAIEIGPRGSELVALCQFPARGVSPKADEVLGLIQCDIVRATSIGFESEQVTPLDASKPYGDLSIDKCVLMEFSFCAIGALPDSLVSERSRGRPFDPARAEHLRRAEFFKAEARRDRDRHLLLAQQLERERQDERLLRDMKPRDRRERARLAVLFREDR